MGAAHSPVTLAPLRSTLHQSPLYIHSRPVVNSGPCPLGRCPRSTEQSAALIPSRPPHRYPLLRGDCAHHRLAQPAANLHPAWGRAGNPLRPRKALARPWDHGVLVRRGRDIHPDFIPGEDGTNEICMLQCPYIQKQAFYARTTGFKQAAAHRNREPEPVRTTGVSTSHRHSQEEDLK